MKLKQKEIVQQYKDSCNKLAEIVNKQLFDGCRRWYWIGEEVASAGLVHFAMDRNDDINMNLYISKKS